MVEELTYTTETGKVYVAPTGKPVYKPEDVRIYETERKYEESLGITAPGIQPLTTQPTLHPIITAISSIYQGQDPYKVIDFINKEPKIFEQQMREIGRRPETETLLRSMGSNDTQLDYFFMPEEAQDEFFNNILRQGRSPDTEKVLRELKPAVTEEEITRWFEEGKQQVAPEPVTMPTLTWLDKVEEIARNPAKLVPFVSSGVEIYTLGKLLKSALDFQNGVELSREDTLALKEYVDRSLRDTDWGYKVADVLSQLLPFAGEFLLTGGIFSVGKTAGVKVATKALEKLVSKAGAELLERKLAQMGVEVIGTVAGGTLRALTTGMVRVPANTLGKQLQTTLSGDEESVWNSAVKSFGEHWVEVVSESTGGMLGALTDPIKGQLVKAGLFKALLKANPGKRTTDVQNVLSKMGYHGVLGEMFEERMADIGHGILAEIGLGDQKFSLPSLEQLSIELASFSVPGIASQAVNAVSKIKPKLLETAKELAVSEVGAVGKEKPTEQAVKPAAKDWVSIGSFTTKTQAIHESHLFTPKTHDLPGLSHDYDRQVIKVGNKWTVQVKSNKEEIKPVPVKPAEAVTPEVTREAQKAELVKKATDAELQTELNQSKSRLATATTERDKNYYQESVEVLENEIKSRTAPKAEPAGVAKPTAPEITPEEIQWRFPTADDFYFWARRNNISEQQSEQLWNKAREAKKILQGKKPSTYEIPTAVKVKPPILPEVAREAPTGRFATTLRNIGDIVGDESNFTKEGVLKPKAKEQFITDVIEAVDNKVMNPNEAGHLLEEYVRHPLIDSGNYEGFMDYWRGRPKTMIEAKPSQRMTEAEFESFFAKDIREIPVEAIKPPVVPPEKPTAVAGMPEELPEKSDAELRKELADLETEYYKNKIKMAEQTKKALVNFVNVARLPNEERGKLLVMLKNANTEKDLTDALIKVSAAAEKSEVKRLKGEIDKLLAKAKPKIVEGIKMGKFGAEVQDYLDVIRTPTTETMQEIIDQTADLIDNYTNNKISQSEFDAKMDILNVKRLAVIVSTASERTVDELNEVITDVQSFMTIGRTERQILRAKQAEKTSANVDAVVDTATGGKGFKPGTGVIDSTKLQENESFLLKIGNSLKAWHNLLDKISKFKKGEPYQSAISKIGKLVDKARMVETVGLRNYQKMIVTKFAEIYRIKLKDTNAINVKLNQLEHEKIDLGTFRVTTGLGKTELVHLEMTKAQIIQHYLWIQDPTLQDTYRDGMHWTYEIDTAIVNALDAKDIAFADYLFEFYREYYKTIDPVYSELYGIHLPNNPMYSGALQRDFEAGVPENVMFYKDMAHYASVKNGSLKTRTKNILLLHDTSVLANLFHHVEQMEHFKAWAMPMRDLRGVFMNKDVRKAIEQYHGAPMMKKIDNFLNMFARGGRDRGNINHTMDWIRGKFNIAALGLKPKVAVQQIPTLLGFMTEMPTKDFFAGVGDFFKNPVENYKWLMEHSPYIIARYKGGGWERDAQQALKKSQIMDWSGKGAFVEKMYFLIQNGDKLGVLPGWWAKYKSEMAKPLAKGETIAEHEAKAQLEAGLAADRTQNSSTIESLSTWQNGHSWMLLATMYQNQPNKYFNIMADNMRNFKYGRGSKPKAIANILIVTVVLPALYNLIGTAFRLRKEDDWKEMAAIVAMSPVNNILMLGSLAQSIYGWISDKPFDYSVSPVLDTVQELKAAISNIRTLISQGKDPYKDIKIDDVIRLTEHIAQAVGQVLGYPTPYLVQVERAIRDKNPLELIYSRWVLEQANKPGVREKIEETTAKLGQQEEYTEKQLNAMSKAGMTIPAKVVDVAKFYSDLKADIGHVLPTEITQKNGYSPQAEEYGKFEIASQKANVIPNIRLKDYFNDDNDTFSPRQYQQQYLASLRIRSLEELKAFTQIFSKYSLGNLTPAQLSLLDRYGVLDEKGKRQFEIDYPEILQNPRDEWFKMNPEDNARLAIGGALSKDGILTKQAYDLAVKSAKELGYPEVAYEQYLPPKEIVDNYFKWQDAKVENEKWQNTSKSWESDLILAKDNKLREWLKYKPSDTPVASLELKVANHANLDLYDGYATSDDMTIWKDDTKKDEFGKTARDRARDELKLTPVGKETFGDVQERIKVMDKGGTELIADKWVDFKKKTRDAEGDRLVHAESVRRQLLLNDSVLHGWAVENGLLPTYLGDWNEKTINIDVQWRKQDTFYDEGILNQQYVKDGVPQKIAIGQIRDKTERENALEKAHKEYLKDNDKYWTAFITRDALKKDIPEDVIPSLINYKKLPEKGFKQEHARMDDPKLDAILQDEKYMGKGQALNAIDPTKIPSKEYDNLIDKWEDEYEEYYKTIPKNYATYTSEDARRAGIKTDRENLDKKNPEFKKDRLRIDAYKEKIPELHIETYVKYHSLPEKGYDQEWLLQEDPDFYAIMKEKGLITREVNFVKLPTREIAALDAKHDALKGNPAAQQALRRLNKDYDFWGILTKKFTKLAEPAKGGSEAIEQLYLELLEMRRLVKAGLATQEAVDAWLNTEGSVLKRWLQSEKEGKKAELVAASYAADVQMKKNLEAMKKLAGVK